MRKHLLTTALAITLAAMTFASYPGFAANPAPNPTPAPNAMPQNTPPNATGQEPHPVMRRAIRQLQNVRQELQNDASRDFDGHRANAVKLIDQAIQQLQQGIQYDKH